MRGNIRTTETILRIFLVSIFIISSLIPTPAAAQALADKLRAWWQERSHNVDLQPLTLLPEQELAYYQPPFEGNKLLRFSPDPDGPDPDRPPKQEKKLVEFTLDASPSVVARDGLVTITAIISNNSSEELLDLTYTDQLEEGLEWVPDSVNTASYDTETRTVSNEIDKVGVGEEVTITYVLHATPQDSGQSPNGRLWVHTAELQSQDHKLKLKARAYLWVGYSVIGTDKDIGVVNPKGGWIDMAAASIYLDRGAVGREAAVMSAPVRVAGKGPTIQFMLEIFETAGIARGPQGNPSEQKAHVGSAITGRLDMPAFLKVKFDQIADLSTIPGGKVPYVATYYEEYNVWVKIPILEVDYEDNSVLVKSVHFSVWGAGLGDAMPQNGAGALLFDQPYTSLFTGSARYSVPIWAPPGRAGMAPSLALSYSSATVDGVLGDVQAPWVGMGWSMDGVEIVRKITTDEDGFGFEDSFVLTLNGAMYTLVRDTNDRTRYYTDKAAFLYIQRHNVALGNEKDADDQSPPNDSKEWWEVVASDGTRYRLGWNQDSEQMALMYGYSCTTGNPCDTPDGPYASIAYAGLGTDMVTRRWRVDQIKDTHGNYTKYTYKEEQPDPASQVPAFDRSSYLETIAYTGFDDPDEQSDLDPGYIIYFETADRTGDVAPVSFGVYDHFGTKLLDKIMAYRCVSACDAPEDPTNDVLARTYDFGYVTRSVPNSNGTLVLDNIVISGEGFTENSVSIPSTTSAKVSFVYSDMDNRKVTGGDDPFTYPRLIEIHNGYGGIQKFTYEDDNDIGFRNESWWYNYRVKNVVVESGVARVAAVGYKYEEFRYSQYNATHGDWTGGELVGYGKVTETTYEFDQTTKILDVEHHFGVEGLDVGRELYTIWKDPSNGDEYRKVVNTYVTDNTQAPFAGWNYRYLRQTENYERVSGALSLINKTVNTKDPGTGNQVLTETFKGSSVYRKVFNEYILNPAPDVHIMDRVSRQIVTGANNEIFTDGYFFYDDGYPTDPDNDLPGLGELLLTQNLINGGNSTSDVGYQYDKYGNVTETCAYTTTGTAGTYHAYNCSGHQKTTTAYNGDNGPLHTYAISTTNAENHTSYVTYFYTLGLPHTVTDPNEYETETRYDGLGRVTETYAPGFITNSTVKFSYPDLDNGVVDAPYAVKMEMRDTLGPNSPTYRSVWGIYDGVGRIIQTQVCTENNGCPENQNKTLLVSDSSFNAIGAVKFSGIQRIIEEKGGKYNHPPDWTTLTHTSFEYDLLGRGTKVTAPGNRVTTTSYNGLTTSVVDPNGNKIAHVADELGRLTKVKEYTGGSTLYATTNYGYDNADRLVSVTDDHSNLTRIWYDWLGRKTQMNDPDMGIWQYAYDPVGNMTRQADARGQRICFYYDDLNRPVGKHYRNNNSCPSSPAYDVEYFYDSTADENKGVGLRTKMEDESTGGNSTEWFYNNFGRTVKETRYIGTVPKVFTTTTDWLGRVDDIEFPAAQGTEGNETLTYSYDALGRVEDLDSDQQTDTLATLAYNKLSQIDTITLGNEVVIDNTYDDDSSGNGTFRLTQRDATKGAATLMDFSYQYDNVGNITRIDDDKLGEILTYDYDDLNRLISADAVEGTEYNYRYDYDYDEIGNLLQVSDWEGSDIIFKDDFESNDFTAWHPSVTDSGDLSTSTASKYVDDYGMQAVIDDTNAIYVQDDTPSSAAKYRARFYYNTNTLSMSSDQFILLEGRDSSNMNFRVEIRDNGSDFEVRAGIRNDSGTWADSSWHGIPPGWFPIEVEWAAATSDGANDGYVKLWVDGALEETVPDIDNDTHTIESARLGVTADLDATTSGMVYFDAFESRTNTYIGPLPVAQYFGLPVVSNDNFSTESKQANSFDTSISWVPAPIAPKENLLKPFHYSALYNNLISYWRLDETSGTREDSYGGNDLTDNSSVGYATGKLGNAADFSSSYLDHVDNPDLSVGDIDFTISAWVNADSLGALRSIAAKEGAGGEITWALYYYPYTTRFAFAIGNGVGGTNTVYANNFGAPSTGTWYHIIAWHDAATDEIGIVVNDGTTDTASTTMSPIDTGDFKIGRLNSYDMWWDGKIDEVVFWKRLLTDIEKEHLYNGGSGMGYPFIDPTATPGPTPTSTNIPTPTYTPTPINTPTSTTVPNVSSEWLFDEGTGTTAVDGSGPLDGTLTNGTGWAAGIHGFAVSFDGENDYVDIPNGSSIRPSGTFSLAAWIYPYEVNTDATIVNKGLFAYDYGLQTTEDGYLEFYIADLNPQKVTGPIPPVDEWTYVVGVYDSDEDLIKLYVNGQLVAAQSVTGSLACSTNDMTISDATDTWHGRIDEVTIWNNRALSDFEVDYYYSLPPSPPNPTPTSTNTPTSTATPTPTNTPPGGPPPTPTTPPTPDATQEKWGTGWDGDVTITGTVNIHETNSITGRTCANGGDAVAYSVISMTLNSATLSATPGSGCIIPGDEVMIINLRGAYVDQDSYSFANTGNYEFMRVDSVSGDTITFTHAKLLRYGSILDPETDGPDDNIGTTAATNQVMLMRVPNYKDLTITGTLTGNDWDGTKYGVVAFRVAGILSGGGTIDLDNLGFRGGDKGVDDENPANKGVSGESYLRRLSLGNPPNQGGGQGGSPTGTGAGGGYGYWGEPVGSTGGEPYGEPELDVIFLGSAAGGGGSSNTATKYGGSGGDGGGILFIAANSITMTGTITNDGGTGTAPLGGYYGGGGAGGSIRIEGNTLSLDSATVGAEGADPSGGAGDGAVGRVAFYYETSFDPPTIGQAYWENTIYVSPTPTPIPTPLTTATPDPWGTGMDGDLTVGSGVTYNINVDRNGLRTCADGGDGVAYSVTELTSSSATLSDTPGSDCLQPGDEVLLISLQAAVIDYTLDTDNVGKYEFLIVGGISGNTIAFTTPKQNYYGTIVNEEVDDEDSNIGPGAEEHKVMLMRVPNYNDVTINGTLIGNPWNYKIYGMVIFRVSGTLSGSGLIEVDGHGYHGGAGGTVPQPDGGDGQNYSGTGLGTFGSGQGGKSATPNPGMGGGGGHATAGEKYGGPTKHGAGGGAYGEVDLDPIYFGAGGGGSGRGPNNGINGTSGGGIVFIIGKTINFSGTISADAEDTGGNKGGGGAGGSIRIEGYDVTLSSGTVTVDGADQYADGGDGRVAVYYEHTKDLGFTPGYLKNTSTGAVIIDFIFSDGFESGDLTDTEWPTTVIDGGGLAASGYADFWGYYGLKAVIDDQTSIYVEDDDSGNGHLDTGGEPRYRARFYFDPNNVTIGSGEILDILVGLDDTTEVFRVQVQDNSGTYQVRVSVKDDSTTWTDSSWYDITDGWNAIEIDWQAASAAAADDGSMELWIDGTTKQTLSSVDNDTRAVDAVRLGVMGVDAGTSGTVYFDDFEARRLGYIDVLASPYTPPQPPDAASWQEHSYNYDDPNQPGIPHAVKAVDHPTGSYDATYEYDANGNMECRVEENITWVQEYNEENRIEKVRQVNGGCSDTDEAGDTQIWRFTYDGNGVRVYQEYVDASGTVKTYYFAGGMYEVVDDGSTTTKVYYSIGGISVAMDDGTDLVYFAADHLSSASIVMSDTGTLLSEQRYMPFGEVRTDVGTAITQTDFGYTGQRDFLKVGTNAKMGLMDYNARFYSPTLGRFTQPDTIIPDPLNPQSWNRYTYTSNNPINRIDPTGNDDECDQYEEGDSRSCECKDDPLKCSLNNIIAFLKTEYGIEIAFGGMTDAEMLQFVTEILHIISKADIKFIDKYLRGGKITVNRVEKEKGLCGGHDEGTIELMGCGPGTDNHEIWHYMDYRSGGMLSSAMMDYVGASVTSYFGIIKMYNIGPETGPSYGTYVKNKREDFAESAREFFDFEHVNINPNERRWEFISHLLATGNTLVPAEPQRKRGR